MHPSLELIFSHLSGGLLWLGADGRIKYANARARQLAGLEVGQQLPDGTLKKAVAVIGSGRHDRPIDMEYLPAAGEQRLLHAQAAPAMTPGDVFVFLDEAAPHGEPLALDNLMTVIRTDLTAPLERLERSLKALRDGHANATAAEEALGQAHVLVDTLKRMVDLSDLWSSDSLLANDRLEVWGLLQQAWQQTQAFAETRRVTVRLVNQIARDEMPVTYGSEFWVRRVVTESLQAALRSAQTGATIDIELRQMGPRVLIVFRNSGMWPAAARNAVMLNDAQARRPATARPRGGLDARAAERQGPDRPAPVRTHHPAARRPAARGDRRAGPAQLPHRPAHRRPRPRAERGGDGCRPGTALCRRPVGADGTPPQGPGRGLTRPR